MSHCFLYRVLECSWFSIMRCRFNFSLLELPNDNDGCLSQGDKPCATRRLVHFARESSDTQVPNSQHQQSVPQRPNSSSRSATRLLSMRLPLPTHIENYSLPPPPMPVPPVGDTPFYYRQAGEIKILNSHFF